MCSLHDLFSGTFTSLKAVDNNGKPIQLKLSGNHVTAVVPEDSTATEYRIVFTNEVHTAAASEDIVVKANAAAHYHNDVVVPTNVVFKLQLEEQGIDYDEDSQEDDPNYDAVDFLPFPSEAEYWDEGDPENWLTINSENNPMIDGTNEMRAAIQDWIGEIRNAADIFEGDAAARDAFRQATMKGNSFTLQALSKLSMGTTMYCPTCNDLVASFCKRSNNHPHHTLCYCDQCVHITKMVKRRVDRLNEGADLAEEHDGEEPSGDYGW